MSESDEMRLSRILRRLEGDAVAKFQWGDAKIKLRYLNYSAGGRGRPDSLLLLDVEMNVLGQNVVVKAPILIEAEKSGIDAAITDLDEFCTRSSKGALEGGQPSFLEIPMLVTTPSPRVRDRVERRELRATFRVHETRNPET